MTIQTSGAGRVSLFELLRQESQSDACRRRMGRAEVDAEAAAERFLARALNSWAAMPFADQPR